MPEVTNIESTFADAIRATGLPVPDTIIADGELHRFKTGGRGPSRNGWYVLHVDGIPAGRFGCWRAGISATWCAKARNDMTPTERQAVDEHLRQARERRDAEAAKAHDAARQEAEQRWEAASPAPADHPYLVAKGIQPQGLRVHTDGALLVPLRDIEGTLHSLQAIARNGSKWFLPGGRIKGTFYRIGGESKGATVICEGFATGATIHEQTGLRVLCAMNAGNLRAVAKALRQERPNERILIAADNDHATPGNPGMTKATEAARAVGGTVVVPPFPELVDGRTDFNDLALHHGADLVRQAFEQALKAPAQTEVTKARKPALPPFEDELAHFSEKRQTGTDETDKTIVKADTPTTWPVPRDIVAELPPAPLFDASVLLPRALAEFVLDEADRMPCAPDYIAAALIVCLGSVVGARCGIKPKRRDDWIVTPNLFGGIVGDPSVKKSPALGTVMRFLDRLEAREAEKLAQAKIVYAAEMAAFEAHQAAVKASMKKAATGRPDSDKMAAAVADMQALQPPEEPRQRRFKSNDSTVEKLGDLLVHNPQGLLVFRDELIGLLASWEREGREGDKAFYLEGWNGTASFNIDRIARGSLHIPNLCLSVFGGIQPDLLEKYLAGIAGSLDNDGRIQRFQVLVYPEAVPWAWRDRYPVKGAREAVRDLFDRLATFDPVQDGAAPADDFVKLPHFHFDDAAQEIFVQWSTELHTVHIANEENPLMQQHLGKFEKLFCAIALILHLAEEGVGPVKADSALRAAAWCEYLAAHARRVYGLVEASKVNTARMVSRRIREGKLGESFTLRELVRKQWTSCTTGMQAEAALAVLEDNGWIIGLESVNPAGGRPTMNYHVNPQAFRGQP